MTKEQLEKCLLAGKQGDAESQYLLGKHFEQASRLGFNAPEIEGKSPDVYWYLKAASQGYAEAQYTLGMYYSRGIGVELNKNMAYYWFHSAAEQGHKKAIDRLDNSTLRPRELEKRLNGTKARDIKWIGKILVFSLISIYIAFIGARSIFEAWSHDGRGAVHYEYHSEIVSEEKYKRHNFAIGGMMLIIGVGFLISIAKHVNNVRKN